MGGGRTAMRSLISSSMDSWLGLSASWNTSAASEKTSSSDRCGLPRAPSSTWHRPRAPLVTLQAAELDTDAVKRQNGPRRPREALTSRLKS
eukprot:5185441-Pyramimonas_sp.AAC.2